MEYSKKMNNKELRIGNLVYHKPTGEVKTVSMFSDRSIAFIIGEEYGDYAPSTEFEPIPINEEWLLKFGFKKIVTDWFDADIKDEVEYILETPNVCFLYHDDWSLSVADVKETFDSHYFIAPNIKIANEVHKFQNLFYALTGSELTINI